MLKRVGLFVVPFLVVPLISVGAPTFGGASSLVSIEPVSRSAGRTTHVTTAAGTISARPASALRASTTPKSVRDAAAAAVLAQRERLASRVNAPFETAGTGKATATDAPLPPETKVRAESESVQVQRNFVNTTAQSVSSSLAEPSAAADGKEVIMGGNTYLSRSTNAGSTWTQLSIPGGPADATVPCCDLDAVYSPGVDTTFNTVLYTNAAQTNGVVRIFVRNGSNDTADCFYDIDPGGTANNLLPDYPHLATSNNFLYLSVNAIQAGSWIGAQMRRFNISQMSSCASTSFNTFTYTGTVGQRIQVAAEGATTVMYWGSLDSTTTFRAASWPESTTTVTQVTRTITASAFNNPDCRGGTGNFDFIERSTAYSIAGFRMRGATGGGHLTFLWPSSPTGGVLQAHLRGITLNTSDLSVFSQPVVYNQSVCFSYPTLSSNSRGDLGLSLAYGGQAGGGGSAAQGAVAVDDSSSSGIFFPTIVLTAEGTENRSDNRFGDYFTVRQSSRCANTWVGTNYALNGGTASSNVNARYVEFQSTDDPACPAPK